MIKWSKIKQFFYFYVTSVFHLIFTTLHNLFFHLGSLSRLLIVLRWASEKFESEGELWRHLALRNADVKIMPAWTNKINWKEKYAIIGCQNNAICISDWAKFRANYDKERYRPKSSPNSGQAPRYWALIHCFRAQYFAQVYARKNRPWRLTLTLGFDVTRFIGQT